MFHTTVTITFVFFGVKVVDVTFVTRRQCACKWC